ncbi:MAG: mechanosensitive ion channel [Magnetococcales bacterium]|nr:mechanosensitive ion channel [Magnetococcales bacterium]
MKNIDTHKLRDLLFVKNINNKLKAKFLVKLLLALLFVVCSLVGPANGLKHAHAAFNLNDGLVAHYSLNGNASDASKRRNNASIYGATPTFDRFGSPNSAYHFNGIHDFIKGPHLPLGNSFSISLWVYLPSNNSELMTLFWQLDHKKVKNSLRLSLTKEQNLVLSFGGGNLTSKTSLHAGSWHHVVVVNSPSQKSTQLYLDTMLVSHGNLGRYSDKKGRVFIGSAFRSDAFEGSIDDVRIFRRSLSLQEITTLYAMDEISSLDKLSDSSNDIKNLFISHNTILPLAKPIPGAAKTALHNLSNEEVLARNQTLWEQSKNDLKASLRAIQKSDVLINEIQRQISLYKISGQRPVPLAKMVGDIDHQKIAIDHANSHLNILKKKMELMKNHQQLLKNKSEQLHTAQKTAKIFANTLVKLVLFIKEINWRVADGTLEPIKIPKSVSMKNLANQRRDLSTKQIELNAKTDTVKDELQRTKSAINKMAMRIAAANRTFEAVRKHEIRERKRASLQQNFVKKSAKDIAATISKLQDERSWLNGALLLSLGQFEKNQAIIEKIDAKLQGFSNAKGVTSNVKMAVTIDMLIQNIADLKQYSIGLTEQKETGKNLVRDAVALEEHLFKMDILAKVTSQLVSEGKIKSGELHKSFVEKKFTDEGELIKKRINLVNSILVDSQKQQLLLPKKIEAAKRLLKELKAGKQRQDEEMASAKKEQAVKLRVQGLSSPQLVLEFKESIVSLKKNQEALSIIRAAHKKQKASTIESIAQLEAIENTQQRIIRKKLALEVEKIKSEISQFAGLLPMEKNSLLSANSDVAYSGNSSATIALIPFQKMTYSLNEGLIHWDTLRAVLEERFQELKHQTTAYSKLLNKTINIVQTQRAYAFELRKKLGQDGNKLTSIQEGIANALTTDSSLAFNKELALIREQHQQLEKKIKGLDWQSETIGQTRELLKQLLEQLGARIDLSQQQQKLAQLFKLDRKQMSDADQGALLQSSLRRLESERSFGEMLLSFIPVDPGKDLTKLLQTFYLGLTELEGKNKNLAEQKEQIDKMLVFAKKEKETILKILPNLRLRIKNLNQEQKRLMAITKMRLVPGQAHQIREAFQAEFAVPISIPHPAAKSEHLEIINQVAATIHDRYIRSMALEHWINIFNSRLKLSGINAEKIALIDQAEIIKSNKFVIDRRIISLIGNNDGTGEINLLRVDNNKVRKKEGVRIFVTIIVIILLTLIAHYLASSLFRRIIAKQKIQNDIDSESQSLVFYNFLRATVLAAVWAGGLLTILSSLGFSIGALVAGLGIFGLALAMASKETLGNLIGGLNIIEANPFTLGEVILFMDKFVEVEHIGLRYSKLREIPTGYLITVPNSRLSDDELISVSRSPAGRKINIKIAVSVSNTAKQIELALVIMRQVVADYEGTELDNAYISIEDGIFLLHMRYKFPFSMDMFAVQTDINSEIISKFKKHSIEFFSKTLILQQQ